MIEGAHTAPPGLLIVLGEIVGTHGVRGLLRFHPANDASATSVVEAAGDTVFLHPHGSHEPRAIDLRSARPHGRMMLLEIDGIENLERATEFVGLELSVPASQLPDPAPDEYYTYQLEGLDVVTVAGAALGTVTAVMPTGSNDVLVVKDHDHEHLIPVIRDVIRSVDLDAGRLTIEPMEGLLD